MSRALAVLLGLLLVLMLVPIAEGQLTRRQFLPVVAREPTPTVAPPAVQFRYRAWSATLGWQPWQMTSSIKDQGGIAGTQGQSRPIEAIQFELQNAPTGANIRYRVHVAFEGWKDWANNGSVAGREASGNQVEAIQVALVGVPNTFISTPVLVANWGWLDYVRDFWIAGTTHQGRRVEAFRTYVRTGTPEPAKVGVSYKVKQQDLDWTDWMRDNDTAGQTGQQRRVESIRVMLYDKPEFMDVEYIVNVEGLSWGPWVRDSAEAGTPYGGRSIFSVQMRLISPHDGSHINYQGHFQDLGWIGPVTEGALGNPDEGTNSRKRLEALRVYVTHDRP
jgi:uncharacterized protein YjdB